MKEELLQIMGHFGLKKQLRKLQEEIDELKEAIIVYDLKESVEYEIPLTEIIGCKEHIAEEFIDVMILMKQIYYYLELNKCDLNKIEREKIERTLKRIEDGYYE